MEVRNLIGVPISQVSIIFISLVITLTGLANATQEMALYLFSILPVIFTFFSYLADKKHFSKFFHMPILVFIISFILFTVAGVLTKQIVSFQTFGSAFIDFSLAFALTFLSIILTKISMIYFFPKEKELHQINNKKFKIIAVVCIAVIVPLFIFIIYDYLWGAVQVGV